MAEPAVGAVPSSEPPLSPSPPPLPVNYLDVKIHDVHNVPPNWVTDGKPPAFADHPFRYEVSFAIDNAHTYTFTHGRLLQLLPIYADYIATATPPPLPSSTTELLRPIRDVPDAAEPPTAMDESASTIGTTANAARRVEEAAPCDSRILWIATPDADVAPPAEEPNARRRARKTVASASPEEPAAPPLPPDEATPPCVMRIPLDAAMSVALETTLLSGKALRLRFVRTLRAGAPPDWEDAMEPHFRAAIDVNLAPLAEPGALQMTATVPLQPMREAAATDERGGKKRSGKRPKTGTPGILSEEVDAEAPHPYTVHGTAATISLRLEKTLVRLTSERVRPSVKPVNLIPTRAPPREAYRDSTQQFNAAVEAMTMAIVQDYTTTGESRDRLFESLQTSGRLAAFKEQLTPLVVKVAREKFLREVGTPDEALHKTANELYVYLLDCIHATLRGMTNRSHGATTKGDSTGPTPASAPSSSTAAAKEGTNGFSADAWAAVDPAPPATSIWLERADEAETLREMDQAARCHQARVASCTSEEEMPIVWSDAAAFFIRATDASRAEQCYREAIACDPTHVGSLLGYGALLLAYNRLDEAAVYLHAAADVQPAPLTGGYLALLCDLRVLALEHGPDYEVRKARWERERGLILKETQKIFADVDFNEVFLAVAAHLLQLQHPDLANVGLTRCLPGPRTELLYARLFELCGQHADALEAIANLSDPTLRDEADILRADCYTALGRSEEAVRAYKSVLCPPEENPKACFGRSYIHLGNLLLAAGRYRDALGVFTLGIQVWPCSLMWLGAGIAYYRIGNVDAAEECLSESNTLNKTNARTWAYLALVCLRKERVELEMVLQQAITQGLKDAALLAELGRDLVRASRVKIGEACLRKALAVEQEAGRATTAVSCTAMFHLASALEGVQRFDEAKEMYTEVVAHTKNEVLKAKAEEQLLQLSKIQ